MMCIHGPKDTVKRIFNGGTYTIPLDVFMDLGDRACDRKSYITWTMSGKGAPAPQWLMGLRAGADTPPRTLPDDAPTPHFPVARDSPANAAEEGTPPPSARAFPPPPRSRVPSSAAAACCGVPSSSSLPPPGGSARNGSAAWSCR